VDILGEVRLADARAEHLRRVLTVSPGQQVRVGLLDGPLGLGTVTAVTEAAVTLHCTFESGPPPRPSIDLLLAVPRPKVLRRLWAQVAALGVGQIILTNAAKVERNYFDTHILAPEHYRPLLLEGLQQARDTRVPAVSVHRQLKVLVEDHLDRLCPTGLRMVAHPGAARSVPEAVRASGSPNGSGGALPRRLLAVGPEGGWTDYEMDLLGAHGFVPVGMGTRTLRTDTACLALLSLAQDGVCDR